MSVSVTHAKTNSVSDWTQAQLDAQIALGNFAAGTTLSQITLPSDWNAGHTITGLAASATTDTTTTANITDSANKRFITDAQQTVLAATSGTNTGDQIVPVNTTGTASNWFSAYNSTTGVFTKSQPATSDLSDISTFSLSTTGSISSSRNAASSSPTLNLTGTRFAGTGTTSTPLAYINVGNAAAPTTWSTSGTALGINLDAASGNFLDCHVAGGNSNFSVSQGGTITNQGGLSAQGSITSAVSVACANTSFLTWTARSKMFSPSDGVIELTNQAATSFTRLQFGGTTASFASIKLNGTALNFRLADDSADSAITASTVGASAAINSTIAQTTLSGTTAGSIVWSQPLQGASWKKFVGHATAYENNTAVNQTITFTTAFTNTPTIIANDTGLTIAVSTTTLTITAPNNTTLFTGNIIVEGY